MRMHMFMESNRIFNREKKERKEAYLICGGQRHVAGIWPTSYIRILPELKLTISKPQTQPRTKQVQQSR